MAPRFLPSAVPNYGEVPRGANGLDLLRSLEGRKTVSSPQPLPNIYMGKKQEMLAGPTETGDMIDQLGGGSQPEPAPAPAPKPAWQGAVPSPTQQVGSTFAGSALGELLGGTGTGIPSTPVVHSGVPAVMAEAPMTGAAMFNSVAPWAAAPLAAMTAYNTVGGVGNLIKGQDMSLGEEAALALPTFGASFAIDPIKNALGLGSGKDKDQRSRDALRQQLQGEGLLSDNYDLTLADGSPFNIGGDGSEQSYNVANATDPVTGRVVGAAQVIASLMTGKPGDKLTTDLTAWLTNSSMSNSGGSYEAAMQNLLAQFSKFAEQRKLTPQASRDALRGWLDQGLIDQATFDAYNAAHESLVEGKPWQFDDETAAKGVEQIQPPEPPQASKILMYGNKRPPEGASKPVQTQAPQPGGFRPLQPPPPKPAASPPKEQKRFWENPKLSQLTAYGTKRNPV